MPDQSNLPVFIDAFLAFFQSILVICSLGFAAYRFIANRFDIDFLSKTPLLKVVLVYVIGLRVFNLIVFALGYLGLGFRETVSGLSILSFVLLGYFIAKEEVKFSPKYLRLGHLLFLPLLVFIVFLMIAASYHPIFIWDHFTHWLLVPREILGNNAAVGMYDYTRSVAIDYPAHQSHLGAMLLYFWDAEHFSDTVTHLFAPFHLLLLYFLVLDLLRLFTKNIWIILASTFLFFLLAASPGGGYLYLTAFYGELFVAFSVSILAFGTALWAAGDYKAASLLPLSVIITSPLIAKQYAWPAIIWALLVLMFFTNFRVWVKIAFTSLALFLVEAFPIAYVAHIARTASSVNRVELMQKLAADTAAELGVVLDTWSRIKLLFTFHEGTSGFISAVLLFGIIVGVVYAVFFVKSRFSKDDFLSKFVFYFSILAVGLMLMILSEIAAIAIFFSPAAASSAPRYFSNFLFISLLLVLSVTLIGQARYFESKRAILLSFFTIVLITALVYPKSILQNWVHGSFNRMTLSSYSAFPHPREYKTRGDLLKKLAEYDGENKNVFFFYHSLKSSLINKKWYYMMARSNPELRVFDRARVGTKEFKSLTRKAQSGKLLPRHFESRDIAFVLVMQPSFFGDKELFGLYSADEFLKLVEGVKLDKARSLDSRAL